MSVSTTSWKDMLASVDWKKVSRAKTLKCTDGSVPVTAITGGGKTKKDILNAVCVLAIATSGEQRRKTLDALYDVMVGNGAEKIKEKGKVTQTSLRNQFRTVPEKKYGNIVEAMNKVVTTLK